MRRGVCVVSQGVQQTQFLHRDAVGLAHHGAVWARLAQHVKHRSTQGQRDVLHQTRVAHSDLRGHGIHQGGQPLVFSDKGAMGN